MISKEIGKKINDALKYIPSKELEELPKTRDNLPQWHNYEHFIWKTGEQMRQILLKNKKTELSDSQIEKIIGIINNRICNLL